MSIATELTRLSENVSELSQSKNAIETAITEKGGTVPAGSKLSDLPDAIDTIPIGATASDLDANGTRTTFNHAFSGCTTLTSIPQLNTRSGTDFGCMFENCRKLAVVPNLDTSNGTSFTRMFYHCSDLTTIPNLDTSKGETFNYMFAECGDLIDLPALDTSNGTVFYGMFYACTNLKEVKKLDISKAVNIGDLFRGCISLRNITFEGQIKMTGLSLVSPPLTIESLRSMINALEPKTSGTFKVSIGSANYAKLTENDIQQIAEKGWTVQ